MADLGTKPAAQRDRMSWYRRARARISTIDFEAIVPNGVLGNSSPPYTAPIAVYVAQRHQMAAAVHGRNRAQMRPSGEIARMAHPTQPMATDRVRGRSRTRISPHPSYSGYIGGSTEFHGLQEAKIGHFGGFRRSGNRFEMRWICGMGMYPVYIRPEASAGLFAVTSKIR